ncbi:MAG: nucleotidyltransferase domain-containing protein [Clostridia bacterium]|nr:nucleotidyltransferase domain-containing protein [Clostridia bacterium]
MIKAFAQEVCYFLHNLPEVKSCGLYGSVSTDSYDEYSDIDIEIDVSGVDNGWFATQIPRILLKKFDVIFYDFAPSLAPNKYVVSLAMNNENPFMMVDVACTATPYCDTVSKQQLSSLNNLYDHTLKVFVANLKHFLRGVDCYDDISRMYGRIFRDREVYDEEQMLNVVYEWLQDNAEPRHEEYIALFEDYM